MGERDFDEVTVSIGPEDLPARAGERCYLLVFTSSSSFMFHLPVTGEVVIGRADTCELSLNDSSVSRQHAKILVLRGQPTVVDLDSHNGTWVNGEQVGAGRPLVSGDAITI